MKHNISMNDIFQIPILKIIHVIDFVILGYGLCSEKSECFYRFRLVLIILFVCFFYYYYDLFFFYYYYDLFIYFELQILNVLSALDQTISGFNYTTTI